MSISSKIEVMDLIILTTIFLNFAKAQTGTETECPNEACSPPAKLTADQELKITLYWDEVASNKAININAMICYQLIPECGSKIKYERLIGASVKKDDQGEITCNKCDLEYSRTLACAFSFDEGSTNKCKGPFADENEVNQCVADLKGDDTLLSNTADRVNKKIPVCAGLAVAFNDKSDSCASLDDYEEFKAYVCDIYNNTLDCCKST